MSALPSRPWREIGDRVFARRYPYLDQEIGAVIGDGEVLVVDARSTPSHAREVLAELRAITSAPVTAVVDTHWHWDHAFGNAAMRPAAIWGHVRTRTRLVAEGVTARDTTAAAHPEIADELRALVIDPPENVFEASAIVELGGRRIELVHPGLGHTDADVVVHVPDARVLFAGDLLEEGAPPWFGDGWPIDWPRTVERLIPLADGAVVPGHGAVGGETFVRNQLAALEENASLARRVERGEIGLDDAIGRSPWPEPYAGDALRRGLAQLRGELEGERARYQGTPSQT
jgi:glyoxylase-like metal-dependent hydrolase (beta-lactamase superfamily II)